MATVTTNVLIDGLSGKFGGSLLFKTMRGKTFVSACARKPDKRKESEAQRNTRASFREAAKWAQMILLDQEKKAYYQQRARALKLPNAYTAAITDYMRKPRVVKTQHHDDTIIHVISKPGFTLPQVSVQRLETTGVQPKILTHENKDTWLVQYTPMDITARMLTLIITDNTGRQWNYDTEAILQTRL